MGYKTVMDNNNSYMKSSDLIEGQSVEGYLLGTEESKYGFNIKFLLADTNKVIDITPHGNLKKLEEEVDTGALIPYLLTRITRTGSYTSKTQVDPKTKEFRVVPTFKVEQDNDQSITEVEASAALDAARQDEGDAPAQAPSKFSSKRR